MNFVEIKRKASGRLYNAKKTEEGGFVNPEIVFQGIDVKDLPSLDELLTLVGSDKARLYLAEGYNKAIFDDIRDPFDKWIPDELDEEQYKAMRTAMIQMVKLTGKTPDEVAKIVLGAMEK